MDETSKHLGKLKEYISKTTMKGELDNDGLVQIIELCGGLLNLKSIPQYAKDNDISYNGAKKCRNVIEVFGNKYVVDNS
mgnify:CR=1 FL=1